MNKKNKLLLFAILVLTLCIATVGLYACKDTGGKNPANQPGVDPKPDPKPDEYTVIFVADGQTVSIQKYTADDKTITEPAVPEKEGYNGSWEQYTLTTGDVTVDAVYNAIEYTVSFVVDDQTVDTCTYTVENKTIEIPEVPAKTGYTGQWEKYTLTTGNLTVNAVYTAIEYTVTFKANDQTVDTRTYTVENKNITEPTVPDKTGYNGVWEKYTLTIGNITVNAVYAAKQYIITLDYQGATAGNTHQTLKVTYNQPVGTLPIPEKTKYEFVGWKHNNKAITAESVWTTDGDATFVAKWKRIAPTESLKYTLNSDGNSYSVTGIGAATDADIVIPSTYEGKLVTSIDKNAFNYCHSLISVTIPDSVTSIGSNAFYDCSNLTNINYLGTLEDWLKINGLSNLMNAYNTPSNKTLSINGDAVTDLLIPNTVTSIPSYAFCYCTNITSVAFEENSQCTSIGEGAFFGCSLLTSITIPDSVTSICADVFVNCSRLQYNEYDNALYLGNVDNPNLVLVKAKEKSITFCTIKENTKIIYESAFDNCARLANINYLGTIESWCKIQGSFNILKDGTVPKTISINGKPITDLVIPDTVTSIPEGAFANTTITSVTIPKSISSIDEYAFNYCHSLISVTIPDSVTSISAYGFTFCPKLAEINYLGTIESWCKIQGLDHLMIGSGSITLSLNGEPITDLVIPDIVTSISMCAFAHTNITNITIPDSVISIGYSAFYGCSSLTIYCEASESSALLGYLDCPVVWDCNNNDKDKDGYAYTVLDGIRYSLKDNVATVIRQPSNITEANIPQKITYNGTDYFVTSIGRQAFFSCSLIASITIPDSVISIEVGAFYDCSSLISITIPDSVTGIGEEAFYGCSSLTSVYYNGAEEDWAEINIGSNNSPLTNATRYYYSESEPALNADGTAYDGNYWHYDTDGKTPVVWKKQ